MTRPDTRYRLWTLALLTLSACASTPVDDGHANKEAGGPVEQATQAIYKGTAITKLQHFVVTPQGIAVAACSAVIYNPNWVLGSAACIAADRDSNKDGILSGAEIPAGSTIDNGAGTNGASLRAPIDLVVKHREATFGAASGSNLVMYHVTQPFDVAWLVANRGASRYYTGNTLNLYTSQTKLTNTKTVVAWGYGTTTFPQLGYASAKIVTDYGSWYTTENFYGKGDTCDGDNGGPDFYYDGSKYQLFGQHALYSGTCGSGQNTNVATRYVATWIQHIAGTLR